MVKDKNGCVIRVVKEPRSCPCEGCDKKHSDVRIVFEGRAYGYDFQIYLCAKCAEKLKKEL